MFNIIIQCFFLSGHLIKDVITQSEFVPQGEHKLPHPQTETFKTTNMVSWFDVNRF